MKASQTALAFEVSSSGTGFNATLTASVSKGSWCGTHCFSKLCWGMSRLDSSLIIWLLTSAASLSPRHLKTMGCKLEEIVPQSWTVICHDINYYNYEKTCARVHGSHHVCTLKSVHALGLSSNLQLCKRWLAYLKSLMICLINQRN